MGLLCSGAEMKPFSCPQDGPLLGVVLAPTSKMALFSKMAPEFGSTYFLSVALSSIC